MEVVQVDATVYYYKTFIRSLIFNELEQDRLKKGMYDFVILDNRFIGILEEFVNDLKKTDYLEDDETEVIKELISYIRYNYKYKNQEEKKQIYSILNELIIKTNNLEGKDEFKFYSYEIPQRLLTTNMKVTEESYFYYKEMIKRSFSNDFLYLNFVIGRIPNKDFEESISLLTNDIYYFMFLNSLLFEQPDLLNGKVLKERTMTIIKHKKEFDEIEVTKEEKKLLKKYKNLYKKSIEEV